MAFTQAEIDNIANAALDYYISKGTVFSSTIQDKPLLAAMDAKAKTFPGGKGAVSVAVKGQYDSSLAGYTHNDTVNYVNPAKIKRASYNWKEHHIGIGVTLTELKRDGISVVDSLNSDSLRNNRGRDETALANLLEDKLGDMAEGYARGLNTFLWGDGTADANAIAGIRAFIKDTPAAVGQTNGGIDQNAAANSWWRNRVNLSVATTAAGDELLGFLNTEFRQLKRYGGKPDVALCGSDFMDRLNKELRARGYYTQSGYARSTDIAHGDVTFSGLVFKYDPTMDDIGTTLGGSTDYRKRCYIIDSSKLCLYYMENEKMKRHSPARPHNQYVMYRAMTTTGVLAAQQLNCHGVYQFS
jgi:hypothetical protein